MLKIGLVTGEYPPMEGGVGAFTAELAQALAAIGYEIHVITSREARPEPKERRISTLQEPVRLPYGQLHPFVKKWNWSSLAQVADVVLRERLDVVNIQYQAAAFHMRSPAANALPWRLQGLVKTAVTFHDLRVPYLLPKAGRLRRFAVNFMAQQAHGVIATNPEDYAFLQQLNDRVRQIPIGSNIEAYHPHQIEIEEARHLLGVAGDDHLLGYFGFLNETKGADTLLHALAQLDTNYHLVFIGGQTSSSDSENNQQFLEQLQALIQELGLTERVHWTGFVAEKRVSTFLYAADLMVMPYRDGVSLRRGTLMAVLAHGRPLLTTSPTVPTPELAHGKNAWFVPPDDPELLAKAVRRLVADGELRKQLGDTAVHVAARFTWDKIAAETAEFLAQLCADQ
jgi:glycosyltransferase involved in cell wall biosynthesis